MSAFPFKTKNRLLQYAITAALVLAVSGICYALAGWMPYRVVALVLLVTVSLVAMLFDILPVLLAAVLSALIWDYFFIPPHFTLQVGAQEDVILLVMYFVIAMVNAALTYRIRQAEKEAMRREEKANTLRLYNTLFNSLSHELRTPIAAIIGATDNLQSGNTNLTPLHRHELVGEIAKASMRLNGQVENLLNMSRIESGAVQPRKDWCDVQEAIYETVQRIEDGKPQQRISISVNPSIPLFKLDKGMLEQVLHNLLQNAVRYTLPQSRINISAMAHADVLQILIEDDGPGFPEEAVPFVFDKFYRLSHTHPGGTGLGLSIVKGFTEAMGGVVSLQRVQPQGASFSVEIPAETSYLKNLKHE